MRPTNLRRLCCLGIWCGLVAVAGAQELSPAEDDAIVIHCDEEIELQVMVDYVGKALGVRFLYGDELSGKKVQIRPSPLELPRGRLMNLLSSLLGVRDLVMVEEAPDLYRIVPAERMARTVPGLISADAEPSHDSMRMVTAVLAVPSGRVEDLAEKLGRFASSPKSSMVPVPEQGVIIATDYESRLALLQDLIAVLDGRRADVQVAVLGVTHMDPQSVAGQISAVLEEIHRAQGMVGQPPAVRGDLVPGSLVVVGTAADAQRARELLERFAPPAMELSTRAYAPRYMNGDRAKELIDRVLLAPGHDLVPPVSIHVDGASGRLFVTAEARTHEAISLLLDQEDHPLPETQRPLRIYRPRNRRASELLATLTQLLGEGVQVTTAGPAPQRAAPRSQADSTPPGRSTSQSPVRQVPPAPPAPPVSRSEPDGRGGDRLRVQGPDYVLTEDEHTNSILAIGTREFHAQLASLIEELDHRRPQVLIEMKLVAITLSESTDLGVELESHDLGDAWDYLVFSSFGLSTIDVTTGQRILTPGVGANGVLLRPDGVPFLFRALATRGNAEVLSCPKMLVSDNARGTLRNVDEAPFTSVNASDTVATTSFAGFESAGTTLSVTPHIAEGDHLTLEFELSFSNFTGSSTSAGVPPPRTTNSFSSTVEVPDG
ncbi:MAG: secretin N-terminal domain-containing protein, partial [bacterium]